MSRGLTSVTHRNYFRIIAKDDLVHQICKKIVLEENERLMPLYQYIIKGKSYFYEIVAICKSIFNRIANKHKKILIYVLYPITLMVSG